MAEKMISLGKASDLHTKRQVYAYITKEDVQRSCLMRSAPSTLTATAATPASSRSALAAATLPRWQFWSSSDPALTV